MTGLHTARAALCAVCAAAAGCAASTVHYSGPAGLPPTGGVLVAFDAPAGFERSGSVQASCRPMRVEQSYEGAVWSDISCSEALLRAALRDRAAAGGAAALTGVQCSVDEDFAECEAAVWTPTRGAPALAAEPAVSVPLAPRAGRAAIGWEVEVDFELAPGATLGPPSTAAGVRQKQYPGAEESRVGDLRARCRSSRCTPEDLQDGLLAAAAAAGAHTLSGVACVELSGGLQCVGRATRAPEPDPGVAAAAASP